MLWLLLEDLSAQVLGVVVFHAQDTKIGLSVGKLRTNANKEISELAKDIVKKVQSFRHCFALLDAETESSNSGRMMSDLCAAGHRARNQLQLVGLALPSSLLTISLLRPSVCLVFLLI